MIGGFALRQARLVACCPQRQPEPVAVEAGVGSGRHCSPSWRADRASVRQHRARGRPARPAPGGGGAPRRPLPPAAEPREPRHATGLSEGRLGPGRRKTSSRARQPGQCRTTSGQLRFSPHHAHSLPRVKTLNSAGFMTCCRAYAQGNGTQPQTCVAVSGLLPQPLTH